MTTLADLGKKYGQMARAVIHEAPETSKASPEELAIKQQKLANVFLAIATDLSQFEVNEETLVMLTQVASEVAEVSTDTFVYCLRAACRDSQEELLAGIARILLKPSNAPRPKF